VVAVMVLSRHSFEPTYGRTCSKTKVAITAAMRLHHLHASMISRR